MGISILHQKSGEYKSQPNYMLYFAWLASPARAVVPTREVHFGFQIEIEASGAVSRQLDQVELGWRGSVPMRTQDFGTWYWAKVNRYSGWWAPPNHVAPVRLLFNRTRSFLSSLVFTSVVKATKHRTHGANGPPCVKTDVCHGFNTIKVLAVRRILSHFLGRRICTRNSVGSTYQFLLIRSRSRKPPNVKMYPIRSKAVGLMAL